MPAPICIIEDDIATRAMMRLALTEAGYETCEAVSGAMALGLISSLPVPHIILLDYVLCDMLASTFFEELEKVSLPLHHTFILMSAASPAHFLILRKLIDKRHLQFLRKPFTIEELVTTLCQVEQSLLY